VNVPPGPKDPPWWQSKKLAALVVGVIAVIVLVVVAKIFNVDGSVVISAIGSVTGLVMTHIGGQSTVDRARAYSPNYPNVPPVP